MLFTKDRTPRMLSTEDYINVELHACCLLKITYSLLKIELHACCLLKITYQCMSFTKDRTPYMLSTEDNILCMLFTKDRTPCMLSTEDNILMHVVY